MKSSKNTMSMPVMFYRQTVKQTDGFIGKVKSISYGIYKKITTQILNHPSRSFFAVLGLLFLVIIVGNVIRKPSDKKTVETISKRVQIFSIGSAPKVRLNAKIEKSGSIKIVAQTSGVVQTIYKTEGQTVTRGSWIAALSTNYQGSVLPSVTRQIAQTNYDFVTNNYDAQKDLIAKRRNLAQSVYNQFSDLQGLTNDTLTDTKNLLQFNESLSSSLDNQLTFLQSTNTNGANDAVILQLNQAKSGLLSGVLSLKSSIRNMEYQQNTDNAPTDLATVQKDIALGGLAMEEKSLDLNKELAKLNLDIARIGESMMYPSTPVNGTIERIYVTAGQSVNPGTVIASITGSSNTAKAIVVVSKEMADELSRLEASTVTINGEKVSLTPLYISKEPTEGSLNSIIFAIPDAYSDKLAQGTSLPIDIPVGNAKASSAIPYIPLDSVYQTTDEATIFIASESAKGKYIAKSKTVKLGPVYGAYVEVQDGLKNGDQIITDRNVIDGDAIEIIQ